MSYILGIIILFVAIVFIHEFGHFILSKLFGIKVEVFSIGFGPKILKKKWKGTEYCLSLFPLGGYVKIHGQELGETQSISKSDKHAFINKPVWQRILVVSAGPIFNFLFAVVVFFVMLGITGEYAIAPQVGRVVESSIAEKSGFQAGDTILEVNGLPVKRWDEMEKTLFNKVGQTIDIKIQRAASPMILQVPVTPEEMMTEVGKIVTVGGIQGLEPNSLAPVIGIDDPESLLAKSGLQTGDKIVSINQQNIQTWDELKNFFLNTNTSRADLKVQRENNELGLSLELPPEYFTIDVASKVEYLGLHSSSLFIGSLSAGYPAEKAGLKVGDRILSVNANPIYSQEHLMSEVQKAMKEQGKIHLKYKREGKTNEVTLVALEEENQINEHKQWRIGISHLYFINAPQIIVWKPDGVGQAFIGSFKRTGHWIKVTIETMVRLFSGKLSPKMIGGPIAIGKIAGDTFKEGVSSFLNVMAIISINLGVINFIPLPIFDGGHFFFFAVEAIRRRPLNERAMGIVNTFGLALIGVLLVFVFYNDLARLLQNNPLWHKIFG